MTTAQTSKIDYTTWPLSLQADSVLESLDFIEDRDDQILSLAIALRDRLEENRESQLIEFRLAQVLADLLKENGEHRIIRECAQAIKLNSGDSTK